VCQQNKNVTHRKHTPLYCIPVPDGALPFQQIALDLITGLPPNGPHDSVLTIVDHGCSRVAIFLPCATTITGPGVAQLYFDNVYRWFGLPSRVISDRDPRFTSHFGRALANKIGAKQNLSTAFHPQTDGLSERKKPSGSNNTCASLQTCSRRTGVNSSQWRPQYTMTTSTRLWERHQARFY